METAGTLARKITRNLREIKDRVQIVFEDVVDILIENDVVQMRIKPELDARRAPGEKMDFLIHVVMSLGEKACEVFLEALNMNKLDDLVTKIMNTQIPESTDISDTALRFHTELTSDSFKDIYTPNTRAKSVRTTPLQLSRTSTFDDSLCWLASSRRHTTINGKINMEEDDLQRQLSDSRRRAPTRMSTCDGRSTISLLTASLESLHMDSNYRIDKLEYETSGTIYRLRKEIMQLNVLRAAEKLQYSNLQDELERQKEETHKAHKEKERLVHERNKLVQEIGDLKIENNKLKQFHQEQTQMHLNKNQTLSISSYNVFEMQNKQLKQHVGLTKGQVCHKAVQCDLRANKTKELKSKQEQDSSLITRITKSPYNSISAWKKVNLRAHYKRLPDIKK